MACKRFLQVILPLRLDWEPWYYAMVGTGDADLLPSHEIAVGDRISVRFGPRTYIGVVSNVCDTPSIPEAKILPVVRLDTGLPGVSLEEIRLWRFMADYYMCSIGEVYHQAYPGNRTDREEAGVRNRQRHEEAVRKALEKLRLRQEKLQERLSRKEEDLKKRHSEKVTAELTAAWKRLMDEIRAVNSRIASLERDDDTVRDGFDPRLDLRWEDGTAAVVDRIESVFREGKTVLLDTPENIRPGVYGNLLRRAMDEGSQALVLVPEIALAQRLEDNLRSEFGDRLLSFNSSKSVAVRRDMSDRLRNGEPMIVLGTRSSVFLPFRRLGLILVDDEHDASYKQDSTPRYNARDMASMLAAIHRSRLLLASSSPSLESVFNCMGGRYARVQPEIADRRCMPEVLLIDTCAELRKNGMVGCLSRKLIAEMTRTINMGGRVMLLRAWGRVDFVENDVKAVFPDNPVGGTDSVDADIMIGTLVGARHADLGRVGLLCIMQPDKMVARQNFRADEYALQTLELFRTRLGSSEGEANPLFVIQSSQTGHPVYQALLNNEDLCSRLLEERREFNYPPYSRLVDVILRGKDAEALESLAFRLGQQISAAMPGVDLEGPMPPEYERPNGAHTRKLRIVVPKDHGLAARKNSLRKIAMQFAKEHGCDLHLDVDPL